MNECPKASIYFHSGVLVLILKRWKQIIKKWGILGLLLVCAICGMISFIQNKETGSNGALDWQQKVGSFFGKQMERAYFQIPRYLDEGENVLALNPEQIMREQFLLLYYIMEQDEPLEAEDMLMAELIKQHEGTDEDVKNIDEEYLDYNEDALHIENSVLQEMERENSLHNTEQENSIDGAGDGSSQGIEGEEAGSPSGVTEFEAAKYPAYSYDWSESWDYETIVSNFYAVDNSTYLKEEYVGLKQLLEPDLSVNKETDGPQILIYHTHSQEDFVDSVPGDPSTTIVGAGEKLANLLEEEYGFKVLHHTGVYDEVRDDAYNKSLPAIEQILEENPTIEVVIDLHRDAVSNDRKLVIDLQGRPTARFMFFNGLSYSNKTGDINYLENPYIQDNLAFSFQAQVAANEYYPGIARKMYLKAYRYNMHLVPKSMLIELGAQNNTVEEIMNACDPLAHILAIVLG